MSKFPKLFPHNSLRPSPMPSIPAALVGFREYSAPNTSASEMLIETKWL